MVFLGCSVRQLLWPCRFSDESSVSHEEKAGRRVTVIVGAYASSQRSHLRRSVGPEDDEQPAGFSANRQVIIIYRKDAKLGWFPAPESQLGAHRTRRLFTGMPTCWGPGVFAFR